MCYWILLATRWRRDGTPFPDRRLISALKDGDPLAIAFLSAAIVIAVVAALYKSFYRR
jgi:hypothetical protein